MLVIPAIDLHRGRVVKLVGGRLSRSLMLPDDPLAVASRWVSQGARRLHVVDLDAAMGIGSQKRAVRKLVRAFPTVGFQVAGGIRTLACARAWIAAGARKVVCGTRAVEDPRWLTAAARELRSRLIVAVDAREDRIVVRGWKRALGMRLSEFVPRVDALPFGGYLYTDVRVEGRLAGFDRRAVRRMRRLTAKPLLYSGGVTSASDVRALRRIGVDGVILGGALYRGTIRLAEALEAAR